VHTKGEKETQSVFCLYFCVSRWLFSFYDFLIELLFVMVIVAVAVVVVVLLLLLRLELKRRRWQWIGFEWCDRWTQQAESATTDRLVSVCSQHSLSTVTTHGDAHTTFNCFFFRWENKTLFGQQSQKKREREMRYVNFARRRIGPCRLIGQVVRFLLFFWHTCRPVRDWWVDGVRKPQAVLSRRRRCCYCCCCCCCTRSSAIFKDNKTVTTFLFPPSLPFSFLLCRQQQPDSFFDKGERIIWRLTATVSL